MDINTLKANCEKNGFAFINAKTKEEALEIAKGYVTKGSSVGLGGSVSVEETGLLDWLISNKDIKLINQYESGISKEENTRRRKEGITADIFVTSTNALTLEGELVNCDGEGNRVAAQIFGSKKLILIVGKNKVVRDIQSALERIKTVAAVKNADRLNEKAVTFGKEPNFTGENISKKYGIITQDTPGRTVIIFVDEYLGY
ncbi:MAG: lactate utilization protein [Campylobacteraceae bacterium]|jgi:L-lactate utilization protein LutB|nr:lactate utilization protein [Campylobacteraceae bacterium]